MQYYSVFAADTLLYAVNFTYDPVTLTSWPLTLNISSVSPVTYNETLYQIWTQSSNPRRSYCDISVWPYDLKNCVTCCARLWDNFHQVWPSTTYWCLNYSAFWCWCVMSRCDRDLWLFDFKLLQHFGCPVFKLCTKFARNWIIQGRVIDDLARFRCAILGVGHEWQTVRRGAWTQLSQTWRGHRAIIPKQEICSSVRISCCIFKRGRLKVEWCGKRRQISHCLTYVMVGEISSIVEALPTILRNGPTFDGHLLRGFWVRWIDKKKERKKIHE